MARLDLHATYGVRARLDVPAAMADLDLPLAEAVPVLRQALARITNGDIPALRPSLAARDAVLARYQPTFALDRLDVLTAEEVRHFLQFKNNQHWVSLQRMGPAICADLPRLRAALGILLDEARPIRERLDVLVPARGPNFVPRLSRAVLTPILLIAHPDRYGVWNNVSEEAMKRLGLWPEFDARATFGERYERVNAVMLRVAQEVGVDLWTLDALWDALERGRVGTEGADASVPTPADEGDGPSEAARFGLERHLHEFLRDNWARTPLSAEWALYEEDGDPDRGYEYPCGVGRIDLLARHRREPRWLVVELKRDQSSDRTLGQLARYMGWVKRHLAAHGERVEGLVIAHQADESLEYALGVLPDASLQLYEVEFRLRPARPSAG